MSAASQNLLDKLKAALAADPKRTCVLAGLSVVLIGLWLHAVHGGPVAATAAFLQHSSAVDGQITASSTTNRPVSNNALIDWLAQPKQSVQRNLFAMHTEFYARGSAPSGTPADSDYSDETAKSASSQTDQSRERETAIEVYKTAALKLKLQSTVLGPVPTALVNGELVREGDTVESFQVVKIEPRKIIVEQDGVTLQINMD